MQRRAGCEVTRAFYVTELATAAGTEFVVVLNEGSAPYGQELGRPAAQRDALAIVQPIAKVGDQLIVTPLRGARKEITIAPQRDANNV